jgi:hypothetical protein
MGKIIKRALLASALASALFALPAWCQDESQHKPGENVEPIINIPVGEVPKRLNTLDLSKIK